MTDHDYFFIDKTQTHVADLLTLVYADQCLTRVIINHCFNAN